MAANGVCKITCKTGENWLRYQRKTLRRRCHNVGSVLCINNFWCTQTNSAKFTGQLPYSPGILGFEMEENNIKLKISGSVHCVLLYYLYKVPKFPLSGTSFFLTKFKMAAKRHAEVVIYELFNIYFIVIPHFRMIFNAKFFSEDSSNF